MPTDTIFCNNVIHANGLAAHIREELDFIDGVKVQVTNPQSPTEWWRRNVEIYYRTVDDQLLGRLRLSSWIW